MLAGRAASAVLRRSLARSAGAASSAGRVASVPVAATSALAPSSVTSISSASRSFSTAIEESLSARDAWQKSCYVQIDYSINEDLTVYDAIQRFAAYDIGCLVTVDSEGLISGVISERDYVNKMALLGRNSKETKIKEISTKSANLITASPHDSVDGCMQKMLSKDIRHLPLLDDEGKVVGILSIKDLVKATVQHQEETIKILSDFALGRGGHFGSD